MINYSAGSFGFQLLFRLHGSAVFRSFVPALVSCAIYLILYHTTDLEVDNDRLFDHPYPMGALISALTFLLAFRANFSYNRYWEAMGAVHVMHSKWLDVGMELAAFHMQSSAYEGRKPPAFGSHPELKSVEMQRERSHEKSLQQIKEQLDHMPGVEPGMQSRVFRILGRSPKDNSDSAGHVKRQEKKEKRDKKAEEDSREHKEKTDAVFGDDMTPQTQNRPKNSINGPVPSIKRDNAIVRFLSRGELKTETTHYKIGSSADHINNKAWDPDKPPLFLQEGAHLLSLMSAVAMSTLRNDLEQADSPLIPFTPNAPWPHVDPDSYHADVRKDWASTTHRTWTIFMYLLGQSRSPEARTLYNAARPFRVVGGVSDAEIEMLQSARGPLAKVALCTMWLQEFISREYLHGSTGRVAPPILSRLYQFTSDGMVGYAHARKIAYVPFPFPHAQITSLFVLVMVGLMPVLMVCYLNNEPFGLVVNLFTVMCFTGLHEVARELESPFQNVPNDIPLNNFQAQFNEALMNMMTGYHPDAFWEIKGEEERPPEETG